MEGYFQVDCAARFADVPARIANQNYNLVLLCYSLRTEECARIVDHLRTQAPHTQMLLLVEGGESSGEAFSCPQISVSEGLYALLKKVVQMIAPDLAGKIRRSPRRSIDAAKKAAAKPPLASAL